jgi:hypothetical protein
MKHFINRDLLAPNVLTVPVDPAIVDEFAGLAADYSDRTRYDETAEYAYRRGEAIILGDHFSHSTRPGASPEPVALLSFTFGTDRMEHWDKIALTAGRQSDLFRLPDGRFQRR